MVDSVRTLTAMWLNVAEGQTLHCQCSKTFDLPVSGGKAKAAHSPIPNPNHQESGILTYLCLDLDLLDFNPLIFIVN